jgi:hypothetical protein
MIKIIKRGKIPEDKVYPTTCGVCRTEFEFTEKDGNVTDSQRDGRFITVKCPVCAKLICLDL